MITENLSFPKLYSLRRYAVCKNKEYYEKAWQKGKTFDYCQKQLSTGRANGFGIITGEVGGFGIVAIDFDGDSADQIAKAIGKWLLNQDSMCWTSGKSGHYQIAYQIPSEHLHLWQSVTKVDLTKCKSYSTIGTDHLEIRYNSCASVLPPSVHPETGYYKWIKEIPPRLLTINESYDLLNSMFVFVNSELSSTDELRMIEEALSHIPADDYHTWVTVGIVLYSHGIDITVWDNWSATSAKYNDKGIDKKWDSFSGYKIGLGTLFYLAKNNGFNQSRWMRENLKNNRIALSKTLSSSPNDSNNNLAISEYNKLIDELSKDDVTEADLWQKIGQYCNIYKTSPTVLYKAITAKRHRQNQVAEITNIKSNIDDLIKVPNEQLDLGYILGDYMAQMIIDTAQAIPTNPDAILTVLLPTIASVIGTKSRIIVNPNTDYILPFILRTMIVARSGSKKSPTARVAVNPLQELNTEAYFEYQEALAQWEASEDEEKGNPPTLKRYIVQDATTDGLIAVHSENPEGFLCYIDECAGYFSRMNKFTKGGDDVQRDLEFYEGKELIKVRADKNSNVFLSRTAINLTGTIQEVALAKVLNNADDLTGISARWIIWAGKMPLGKAPDVRTNTDNILKSGLKTLFNCLKLDDYGDLLISDDAYSLWAKWQNGVMESIQDLPLPQLENKHSKIESDCIKFAGILHYYYKWVCPDLIDSDCMINKTTMERAITLSNYYLRHFAYNVTKAHEGLLDSQLLKIIELCEKKGELTIANLKRYSRDFKDKDNAVITDLLLNLIDLGKLERVPTDKGLKVKLKK